MAIQRTARQRSSRLRSHCECMAAFGKGAGTVLRRSWALISRRCDESSAPRPLPRLAALEPTLPSARGPLPTCPNSKPYTAAPFPSGTNPWRGPRA
jgi:hypothetical protein